MPNSTFSTLDEYFARFPHDQSLPLDLIAQIVTHRAAQNAANEAAKKAKRKRT